MYLSLSHYLTNLPLQPFLPIRIATWRSITQLVSRLVYASVPDHISIQTVRSGPYGIYPYGPTVRVWLDRIGILIRPDFQQICKIWKFILYWKNKKQTNNNSNKKTNKKTTTKQQPKKQTNNNNKKQNKKTTIKNKLKPKTNKHTHTHTHTHTHKKQQQNKSICS